MSDFEYVNRAYNVNACLGRRVTVDGKPGTIIEDRGGRIGVNFDSDKPGRSLPCHPTWNVVYHEEIVKPRRASRSARRYQEYLRAKVNESFAEWLGIR